MKEKILVSACLLGHACRYDGGTKPCAAVQALAERYQLVPVCPESLGGLTIPRPPAEQVGERVMDRAGQDVTDAFLRGASRVLEIARREKPLFALLKARSPSCGHGQVYDGTFSGKLRPGEGVAAASLLAAGIPVFTEEELGHLPSEKTDTEL